MNQAARLINLLEQKKNDKPSKIDKENLGVDLKDFELVPAKELKPADYVLLRNPNTNKWGAFLFSYAEEMVFYEVPYNVDFEISPGQFISGKNYIPPMRGKIDLVFLSTVEPVVKIHVAVDPDEMIYRARLRRAKPIGI